ncbi:MAG: carboxypeptidase regulatory-like domain-containing protein, partial [Bacteroidetes bacterium]|nr:carboxypeptidase regulatory-like domain-containing protein [Bacteroidota bacterium]
MRNTSTLLAALLLTSASFRGLAQTGSRTTASKDKVAATAGVSNAIANGSAATTGISNTATNGLETTTPRVGAPGTSATGASAEDPGKIEGKVGSSTGQPIEAATIALLNAKDSSVIKVTSTNKSGQFHFNNLPAGKYIISATSVGYGAVLSQSFEVTEARTSQTLP